MSTTPQQLSPQDFAARIRAKYPGAYDSLSDDDLTSKVVAKHPEYQSVVNIAGADTGITSPADEAAQASRDANLGTTHYKTGTPEWKREGVIQGMMESAKNPALVDPRAIMNSYADMLGYSAAKSGMPTGGNTSSAYDDAKKFAASAPPGNSPIMEGLQRGGAHALTDTADMASSFTTPTSLALMAAGPLGKAVPAINPLMKALQGGAGLYYGVKGGQDVGHALNDQSAPLPDRLQEGLTGASQVMGGLAGTADTVKTGTPVARAFFGNDLAATSHDILNKGAVDVKSKLWDAHNQVSERVGQLKNDIAAADYQSGKPQIPTADLQSKVLDLSDKYRASDSNTPAFSTAAKRIAELPANLSFKDLADLKSEIGTKWSKTPDGTPDSAAINELRSTIDKKLSDRATELDRTKQYGAYNKLWSTLMGYESDGVMGKLLNADNGAKLMDVLKDPANKAELARTMDSLKDFGLDPDTLKQFQKSHAPLHDYVNQTGMNRLRLVMQHPATAFPGMVAGSAIGSATGVPGGTFLGGTAGAVAGARIPARLGAARAVAELGAPPLTGEMSEAAKVRPVGSGERPSAPQSPSNVRPPAPANPNAAADAKAVTEKYLNNPKSPEYGGEVAKEPESKIDTDEIVRVLSDKKTGLGYDKAEAIRRAKMAAQAVPNNQEEALNYAIRGGPDKAKGINTVKNTASNSPEAAAAANDQAAQKLFGKPYDSLSLQEKMQVFSEGAKIQDQARAQNPQEQKAADIKAAFSTAKGAASDGFIDQAWQRAQQGKDMPFSDNPGSIENRLAEARKAGKLNSREDVEKIVKFDSSFEGNTGKFSRGSGATKEQIAEQVRQAKARKK